MRLAPPLAVLLAIVAFPATLRAQSYYARWAVLASGETRVAMLARTPIEVVAWHPSGEPEVRYADRSIEIRARLTLDAPRTEVLVGVARAARLDTGTEWSAWLAPGWAPLRRGDGSRITIALEEGLPFSTAEIVERVPGARGVPPEPGAALPVGSGWRSPSSDDVIELRAAPSEGASRWEPPLEASFRRRPGGSHGWIAYDVSHAGVVVRAYAPRALALGAALEWSPIAPFGAETAGWCEPASSLDGRVLPAGTELFAPFDPAVMVGRTRRAMVARRIANDVLELREVGRRHWIVRARVAVAIDELEPSIVSWPPDEETCFRHPL